jgi:hypothetical protein
VFYFAAVFTVLCNFGENKVVVAISKRRTLFLTRVDTVKTCPNPSRGFTSATLLQIPAKRSGGRDVTIYRKTVYI